MYQRLPQGLRGRLDAAILLRPAACPTLEAIAEKLDLKRYGLSPACLKRYAEKLERFVRPAMTAHVMAGVLGCLPARYRRRLVAGSQVLLLSRLAQALSDEEGREPLTVAELSRLAVALGAVTRSTGGRAAGAGSGRGRAASDGGDQPIQDPTRLAEAVRMVYGLRMPDGRG